MALSPVLRLPTELQYNIIDQLEIQDKARLSITCRQFASIIERSTHGHFLDAESNSWAISKNLYTCKGCARFRRLLEFSDEMRKGRQGRGGTNASSRLCLECGVKQGLYITGEKVVIMGQRHSIDKSCKLFHGIASAHNTCGPCLLAAKAARKEKMSRGAESRHYESDDDWKYSTQSYARDRHLQELPTGLIDV